MSLDGGKATIGTFRRSCHLNSLSFVCEESDGRRETVGCLFQQIFSLLLFDPLQTNDCAFK
jgi:hypothetical protein